MKSYLAGVWNNLIFFGGILLGAVALFSLVILGNFVGSDEVTAQAAVFSGLIASPLLITGLLATLSRGGLVSLLLRTAGLVTVGAVYALGTHWAEIVLDVELGSAVKLTAKTVLFVGVAVTAIISIMGGIYSPKVAEYKSFWQPIWVPFAKNFVLLGVTLVFPIVAQIIMENALPQFAPLQVVVIAFGRDVLSGAITIMSVAGLAGATLIAIPVIAKIYYRPWFQLGRGAGESTWKSALWVMFTAFLAVLILTGSYFLMEKTGAILLRQQVGASQPLLAWGVYLTAVAIFLTGVAAWWRMKNYKLVLP